MTRRTERTFCHLACVLSLALPLAACGGMGGGAGARRAQTEMSDAEIAAVLDAVNRGEIQQARLARENASATEVRNYANTLLTGHEQALEQQQQILSPRGVTPVQSTLSEQVRQRGQQVEQRLQGLSGEQFDRAFLQAQLAQHRDLLQLLEQRLIPAAQDPAYRVYLERLRDDLEMHLQTAQRLQTEVIG